MFKNLHMTSNLPGEDKSFGNCSWLAGIVLLIHKYNATTVFTKVMETNNIVVERTDTRPIPLSMCPCSRVDNTSNCLSPTVM